MKTFFRIAAAAALFAAMTACDAFHSLTKSRLKTAQGSPYELIVVCPQQEWTGELGDTLRSILTAPVPYLNQTEPLFDVLRVTERGFTGMVADHRNILKIVEDPSLAATNIAVQYDVTAEPQIVLTLQGPDDKALTDYLSEHRESLVQVLEKAERDRAVKFAEAFSEQRVAKAIKSTFGVDMTVPKGYVLAADEKDFLWARYEFAARIPGPSDGSYMTTSEAFEPDYRMFRMEGRLWCELRGFWDVHGDFMGGPFVSYTTVDTATGRVLTIDCYVYSPKNHKRNYVRGVEHLLYLLKFPEQPRQ